MDEETNIKLQIEHLQQKLKGLENKRKRDTHHELISKDGEFRTFRTPCGRIVAYHITTPDESFMENIEECALCPFYHGDYKYLCDCSAKKDYI